MTKPSSKQPMQNKLAKLKQYKNFCVVFGTLLLLVCGSAMLFKKPHHHSASKKHRASTFVPDMTGVVSPEFNGRETTTLVEAEREEVKHMKKMVSELQDQLKHQEKIATEKNQQLHAAIQAMHQQLDANARSNKRALPLDPSHPTPSFSHQQHVTFSSQKYTPHPIHDLSARMKSVSYTYGGTSSSKYHHSTTSSKSPRTYVPAGTFVRAVMLGGADANASVDGKKSSTNILFRILDRGTLPNGYHSSLNGCFAIGAIWGDISSERGEVRIVRLSCVRPNHHILDTKVYGTIFGMGGKNGVRGRVVMRNGKILMYAGMSGMLSGIGSALQQSVTTQSISPLGATETIPSSKVFQYGAYGGANTALSKLAGYYIKRADQYHPVIEIAAGSVVDVMFINGFDLMPDKHILKAQQNEQSIAHRTSDKFYQELKQYHLGQSIPISEQK